jgi:hypothetical protein
MRKSKNRCHYGRLLLPMRSLPEVIKIAWGYLPHSEKSTLKLMYLMHVQSCSRKQFGSIEVFLA